LIANNGYYYPLLISSVGIVVCIFTSFFATSVVKADTKENVMLSLNLQLLISTLIMTPALYFCSQAFLPPTFTLTKAKI